MVVYYTNEKILYCTVPSPGVDQSQSQRRGQGQHMVGPHEGPQRKEVNRVTT